MTVANERFQQPTRFPVAQILGIFLATGIGTIVVRGHLGGPGTLPLVVSVLGCVIGLLGLSLPPLQQFPTLRAAISVSGALLSSSIVWWIKEPFYEAGQYTFGVIICATLIATGHLLVGVSAGLTVLALRVVAVISTGADAFAPVDYFPVALLVLALGWNRFRHRLDREEELFRRRGQIAIAETRTQEQVLAQMRMGEALRATGARRVLGLLADGRAIDPEVRSQTRVAEAALRDHIRCPWFTSPVLSRVVSSARRRGADVHLVGDSEKVPDRPMTEALERVLVAAISPTGRGDRVTLRRLPDREDSAVVTLLIAAEGGMGLTRYTADGEALSGPVTGRS